jgi:hypothetical protein
MNGSPALDPRIETLYAELAELDDRWDMSDAQKTTARTQLLWSVVVIKRRQTSLLADGKFVNALLTEAAGGAPREYRRTRQRFRND